MPNTQTEARKNLNKHIDEMNSAEYQNYLNSLDEQEKKKFETYLQALKDLNNLTDRFYRTDAGHINLNEETYQQLMTSYSAALKTGGVFENSPVPEGMKQTIQAVQDLLIKDYGELSRVSVRDEVISLPMVIDRARGLAVQAPNRKIDSVGGALSTRMKVSVLNDKGKRVDGFFTTHSNLELVKDLARAMGSTAAEIDTVIAAKKAAKDQSGDIKYLKVAAETLRKYSDPKKAQTLFSPSKMSDKDVPWTIRDTWDEYKAAYKAKPSFIDFLDVVDTRFEMWRLLGVGEDTAEEIAARIEFTKPVKKPAPGAAKTPYEIIAGLRKSLKGVQMQESIYKHVLNVSDGANISRRNCAFSTLAGLCGVSGLVAGAQLMTIQQNGKTIEGVFMENAKGMGAGAFNMGHPIVKMTADEFVTPQARMELAAVQLVDYIGLNADRHTGNMSYITNEKGQLVGIQCYDNDSTFGEKIPDDNRKTHVLAALDNIKVIPRAMADRLNALTPEMLRAALRPDLNDKEIEATCQRMEKVKARLGKEIRVVEVDEWKDLSMKELAMLNDKSEQYYDWTKEKNIPEPALKNKTAAAVVNATKNGLNCKNIFETVLVVPTRVRAQRRDKINEIMAHEDFRRFSVGDLYKNKEYLPTFRQYAENKIDAAGAQAYGDDAIPELPQFTDVMQTFTVPGVHPGENAELAQKWLAQLRKPVKEAKFQEINHRITDAIGRLAAMKGQDAADAEFYKNYRKEMRTLLKDAKDYLALRVEAKKSKKDPVSKTLGEMILHLQTQVPLVSAALKEDHERQILQTLDLAHGMEKHIDALEERVNLYCTKDPETKHLVPKENVPEHLAGYAEMAQAGLQDLIDLSQKGGFDAMSKAQKNAYYEAVANCFTRMLAFEQAEYNLKNHVEPDTLALQSQTEEDRRITVRTMAADANLRKMLGITGEFLRPEHLTAFCADAKSVSGVFQQLTKVRASMAKRDEIEKKNVEISDKLQNMRDAAVADAAKRKQEAEAKRKERIRQRNEQLAKERQNAGKDGAVNEGKDGAVNAGKPAGNNPPAKDNDMKIKDANQGGISMHS